MEVGDDLNDDLIDQGIKFILECMGFSLPLFFI